MKNLDVVICAHCSSPTYEGPYDIIYACVSLALNAFPSSRVFVFRTDTDEALDEANLKQRDELISRGAIMVYNEDPLRGDRGALTTQLIWEKYLSDYACGNYCLFTLQDCWIVQPSILVENVKKAINDNKDGMCYHSVVAQKLCYGTVMVLLKDSCMSYYIDDPVLGVVPCVTEWEIHNHLKHMDIYLPNTPEKALTQYGLNYYFGFTHFHDKKSLKYYLDLYNILNPTMAVSLDWDRIPDCISIHSCDRSRERLMCPDSFDYTEKDMIATAMDDIGERNADPLNGFDRIIRSGDDYLAIHKDGHSVPVPFAGT